MLMIQVLFRLLLIKFFHEKIKHIEVDCHCTREVVDKGVITLPHVSIALQIAVAFTKSMARQLHQFLVGKLMLLDPPTSIRGATLA